MTIISNNLKLNKNIHVNFDGGNLSSDTGLLLYKEFDDIFGFSKIIKNLDKKFYNSKANYQLSNKIIQKIYQNIAGYHTDNCADDLRDDRLFKLILKNKIASQPTLSRINQDVTEEVFSHLKEINKRILAKAYAIDKPKVGIIDPDSTILNTYGNQELSEFIFHYGDVGYHPLLVFDGVTGDFITGVLRKGKAYTSNGIVELLKPVIKQYEKYNLEVLYLRGDSGFAIPELYVLCEANNNQVKYVIRLKANNVLYESVKEVEDEFYDSDELVRYYEFEYKASSWNKARRVICKMEKISGELLINKTFIVTNDQDKTPKEVVEFYAKRGTMENFIKESKLGFNLKNMSSESFMMNQFHMFVKLLAYNFNNIFRRLVVPQDKGKSYRIETLRTRLIKIAGKIVKTGRQVSIKMSSSFPYKELYYQVVDNLRKLTENIILQT